MSKYIFSFIIGFISAVCFASSGGDQYRSSIDSEETTSPAADVKAEANKRDNFQIQPGSVYDSRGLRDRDVIRALDGEDVDDPNPPPTTSDSSNGESSSTARTRLRATSS